MKTNPYEKGSTLYYKWHAKQAEARIRELEGRINRADRYLALGSPNGAREALAPPDSEPDTPPDQTAVDDLVAEYERDPAKREAIDEARRKLADSEPAEGERGENECRLFELKLSELQDAVAGLIDSYADVLHCECDHGDMMNPPVVCDVHAVLSLLPTDQIEALQEAIDASPSQRRDAGDALRRALSDPETMQRVTERAAEQQDAMLERRDALEVIGNAIESALNSYQLQYTRDDNNEGIELSDALTPPEEVTVKLGLEERRLLCDHIFNEIEPVIRQALSRTSDEGTGCVVPEEGTTQFEALAKAVHNAWWDEKERQGSAIGHPDAIPYEQLSEDVKEYDRATVRTVLNAMLAAAPKPDQEEGEE